MHVVRGAVARWPQHPPRAPCSLGLEDRCPLGEDVLQPAASSPATPAGCWSPAVLAPAPREDICSPHRFDSPRLPR